MWIRNAISYCFDCRKKKPAEQEQAPRGVPEHILAEAFPELEEPQNPVVVQVGSGSDDILSTLKRMSKHQQIQDEYHRLDDITEKKIPLENHLPLINALLSNGVRDAKWTGDTASEVDWIARLTNKPTNYHTQTTTQWFLATFPVMLPMLILQLGVLRLMQWRATTEEEKERLQTIKKKAIIAAAASSLSIFAFNEGALLAYKIVKMINPNCDEKTAWSWAALGAGVEGLAQTIVTLALTYLLLPEEWAKFSNKRIGYMLMLSLFPGNLAATNWQAVYAQTDHHPMPLRRAEVAMSVMFWNAVTAKTTDAILDSRCCNEAAEEALDNNPQNSIEAPTR